MDHSQQDIAQLCDRPDAFLAEHDTSNRNLGVVPTSSASTKLKKVRGEAGSTQCIDLEPGIGPSSPEVTGPSSSARSLKDIELLDLRRIQQSLSPMVMKTSDAILLGISGDRKYRVTNTDNDQYFVKIFNHQADGSIAPVAHDEIKASVWAAGQGYGPQVVVYDTQKGILVTEYLMNEMGDWDEGGKEPRLSATLATMRSLHSSSRVSVTTSRHLLEYLAYWEAECGKMTLQQEQLPFSQFARKVVKACADKLAAFTPSLAFCHNDFHQANVLFSDGKAWIVDWATGCIGDPMRDVAYFACHIEIQGSTDLEALLQKYDANLSQEDVLRAKCWFAWTHAHTYLRVLLDTSLGDEHEKAARLLMSEAVLVDATRGLDLDLEGVSVLRAEVSAGSPGVWTALADFLCHWADTTSGIGVQSI